jgi:hypothetical protein
VLGAKRKAHSRGRVFSWGFGVECGGGKVKKLKRATDSFCLLLFIYNGGWTKLEVYDNVWSPNGHRGFCGSLRRM